MVNPLKNFFGLRKADLVFDPTLAGGSFAHSHLAPTLLSRTHRVRPDLRLNRTMLTGNFPAYVDRFACDWLRLSTTDPNLNQLPL